MYDHNQTVVPASFLALYSAHGRPTRTREEIEARHEACEDLALHVAALCGARSSDASDASGVLRRCLDGLTTAPASTTPPEAVWVVRRVAELLEWDAPAWLVDAAGKPA